MRLIWALAILAALLTGCGAKSHADSALKREACPPTVELHILATHSCYLLKVPLDRGAGSRGTGEVFVLKVVPAQPPRAEDPVLVLGGDLGDQPEYGGYAPLPDRVHRVEWAMDPRGTGGSTPRLTCPDQGSVSTFSADEPSELASVAQNCLSSYDDRGLDVRDFAPAAVSADAEALRRSLGIQMWNVETVGSNAVLASDYASRYPSAVRSLILDSPLDSTHTAASDTRRAWDQLVMACRDERGCHQRFPDVQNLWDEAVRTVEHQRVALPKAGRITSQTVARLVRTVLTGPGPEAPGQLLGMLDALAEGTVSAPTRDYLEEDSAACLGYRPLCLDARDFALGFYLTQACSLLPPGAVRDRSGLGLSAFGEDDPYRQACRGWPRVDGRDDARATPTLVLSGRLDPFVAHQVVSLGPRGFAVDFPDQTHNLVGYDACAIGVRNAWVDHIEGGPKTGCRTSEPDVAFAG